MPRSMAPLNGPASNVTFVFNADTMLKEDRRTITTATNHVIPSFIIRTLLECH
jgi:hypothetical protein